MWGPSLWPQRCKRARPAVTERAAERHLHGSLSGSASRRGFLADAMKPEPCAGYVASGPLVLLVELVQRLGPQPTAGQVYALFAVAGVATLAGAVPPAAALGKGPLLIWLSLSPGI